MNAIPELRGLYRERRLLPFIGAGVSASVEWSEGGRSVAGATWEDLVNEASAQLGFRGTGARPGSELLRVRGTDLQILEYFKLRNGGATKLTNWLMGRMRAPDDALKASEIHRELAAMTNCEVLYTTNFDNFIERSFQLHGRPCRAVAVESEMRPPPHIAEIVKFHGDWDHPGNMVLTESDYEKRLAFQEPLDLRLWSDLLNRSALFIGYSFRDPNVAYLFHLLQDRLPALPNTGSGRRAYVVLRDPSQFESRLFRERNIEVVAVPGEGRIGAISELLKQIRE